MNILELEHVTGGYGKTPIIHDVSFSLQSNEIVGLIGLNGAGKSTTIKHILGLLSPHSGDIKVLGKNIQDENITSHFSDIPQSPILYEELTLRHPRHMTETAYSLTEEEVMTCAEPLLKLFNVE